MAKYTCRIEADKSLYPVLLSNGNLIEQGYLEGGKYFTVWEDPFKKPWVTCRDWFQLSLKEGLTVFRDQEFSYDMGSRTVKRIADVSKLQMYQYPQVQRVLSSSYHYNIPSSYIYMDCQINMLHNELLNCG
ncbi:puromycin-sensitive aminopeptidase [Nicotiana attenuata]|uniref:Puromycin-sensitive aminopeptidase n=1 Tax=Nicotiana attenuata TaxID=49451 RepID=A0A314L2N8_NICAT|nr:puromycin-sensitive aminopeptidase [Nicotiana attenuata]